jgi:hypothetical protein
VGEAAPPLLEIPAEQSTDLFYSPPKLQMAALNNIMCMLPFLRAATNALQFLGSKQCGLSSQKPISTLKVYLRAGKFRSAHGDTGWDLCVHRIKIVSNESKWTLAVLKKGTTTRYYSSVVVSSHSIIRSPDFINIYLSQTNVYSVQY